ncbi:NADH-ubiquinone oxidoreductase-F iron-sulfur binding region domain-containing protein [Limnochorda pilosa]|uniref:NADH dehydrogenase n=1 Tax=Limnochorda pilosa TaxID=1555112 RepID=A0A0K2SQ36_LIMPI|nr:NADH-ubiquinone oxidoreductase-F iron-sulfur binding region domain-containing protein [Limnochorda pilosa]BAS29233.1 NADH dehydrogenase [Limnochorda pilosa]
MAIHSSSAEPGPFPLQRERLLLVDPEPDRSPLQYPALRVARQWTPDRVVAEIEAAGLRGRGGAAFPTATKWRAAAEGAPPRYVVVNGGEDEPGSRKDRFLMENHPHRVIEGALIAARAVGASKVFFYVNRTFTASLRPLWGALEDAGAAGLLGDVEAAVVEAPPEYVAGEETAALEVIEGRPARPRRKPPYPVQAGLWGRPTVVNNVETLAQAAAIVHQGAERVRRLGTAASPGTLLLSVGGGVNRPGVFEVPFGTPLRAVVEDLAGGVWGGRSVKAILPGGPSAGYLPGTALDTPIDYDALAQAGSWVGCGAIRVVPRGMCMVEELLRLAPFFAEESCGQCGTCLQGTRRILELLENLRLGIRGEHALDLLRRLGTRLPGTGLCGLVGAGAAPVASAIRWFPDDFLHHARYGVCPQLGPVPGGRGAGASPPFRARRPSGP